MILANGGSDVRLRHFDTCSPAQPPERDFEERRVALDDGPGGAGPLRAVKQNAHTLSAIWSIGSSSPAQS